MQIRKKILGGHNIMKLKEGKNFKHLYYSVGTKFFKNNI